MLRKLQESFTATHLTILILGAMFAPGLVYAVAPTNVVVQDPSAPGRAAHVNLAGQLSVVDPYAAYRNNPANLVRLILSSGSGCNTQGFSYTIPAGKALIITATSFNLIEGDTTRNIQDGYLFADANCQKVIAAAETTSAFATVHQDWESGLPVASGSVLTPFGSNSNADVYVAGYLIPAAALPPSGTAEANAQIAISPRAGQPRH